MSNDLSTSARSTDTSLSRANRVGLGLAGLLGLIDLAGPVLAPTPQPGEEGPPMAVLIAGAVLGVITLAAVVYTWRTGNRVGARVVAGTRILSAITALPAFFVAEVPPALVAGAAVGIVVALVAVALVLSRPKLGAAI